MAVVRGSSAVVVEWRGRKPCCVWLGVKTALRIGRMRRSNTLEVEQRREMGRYDLDSSFGLPGFRMGIIMACFHRAGSSAFCMERLQMSVR